jgi:hypothetical protein
VNIKKTRTSTETTTPNAAPELQFALDQQRSLFNLLSGRQAAPFQTYADFAPETLQGLDLTAQRALAGSGAVDAAQAAAQQIAGAGFLSPEAQGYISKLAGGGAPNAAAQYLLPTAQGAYLDFGANPYFQAGVGAINDSVGSIFERAGRTGSGANQSSVARGVGDLAAGVYNQERANQLAAANALAGIYNQDVQNAFGASGVLGSNAGARLNAAGLAPALANQDYIDLQNLLNVGTIRQGQDQRSLDEQLYRYNFPYENAIQATNLLNLGVGQLGPLLGQTTTGKSTEKSSGGLLGSILGGLLTAGSLVAGGPAGGAVRGFGNLFGGAPQLAGTSPQLNYGGGYTSGTFRLPFGG